MFTATDKRMQIEMNNSPQHHHTLAMQLNSAVALSFKFIDHLFTMVIDVLINVPVMNTIWCERRELELLTSEHVKDIGLSPDHVRLEVKRSFFDIPHDRKRSWKGARTVCCYKQF